MNDGAFTPDDSASSSPRSLTRGRRSLYLMVARPKPTTKAIEIDKANKRKNAQRPHKGLSDARVA